ncbi:exodeoxyribonuclease III [Candidatus Ferrigenium straubiae]|jgi:exodeoxyribonuclease-3|uniref:exodeoxyribonuclease III n=1 Tax=Candidatus Ferrigenium straubiae TaxID=2919506 RepID=UPI003F4A8C0F
MRIITLNLNGIRSAATKGFYQWLAEQEADIVCLQELKAQAADMTAQMLAPSGYRGHFHYAEKKGYSGVGIYTRREPDAVIEGLGIPEFDAEGRYLEAQFGNLSVVSLYLPSGSSGEERQAVKFGFMEAFMPHLVALRQSGREVIVCGDWNIAHTEKDLRNWRGNRKNSGFLPEERAWLTRLFDEVGFIDVFRRLHPELEAYTWWSNRGRAWEKDVGWRIDCQIATPGIAARAKTASIYREQRFSDHAPLIVDYSMGSQGNTE